MIQQLIDQVSTDIWEREDYIKAFYSGKENTFFLTTPEQEPEEKHLLSLLFFQSPPAQTSELNNILWLQAKKQLNLMEV